MFANKILFVSLVVMFCCDQLFAEFYGIERLGDAYQKYDEYQISSDLVGLELKKLVEKKRFADAERLIKKSLATKVAPTSVLYWWHAKIALLQKNFREFEKSLMRAQALPLLKNTNLAHKLYEDLPAHKKPWLVERLIDVNFFEAMPESSCPYFELDKRKKRASFLYLLASTHPLPAKIMNKILTELYVLLPEAIDGDALKNLPGFDQFYEQLPVVDLVTRMDNLTIFGKNSEARATFVDVDPRFQKMPLAKQCELNYADAKVDRKMRKYTVARARFSEMATQCPAETVLKSRYMNLMLQSQMNDDGDMSGFATFVRDYPEHTFADDVLLFKATILIEKKMIAAADDVLRDLIERYPDGDMVPRALSLRAFIAAKNNRVSDAIAHFASLQKFSAEDSVNYAQAKYWQARLSIFPKMEKLTDGKASSKSIQALKELTSAPPTIYSWLAYALLEHMNEDFPMPAFDLSARSSIKKVSGLDSIAHLITSGFREEALALLEDMPVSRDDKDLAAYMAIFYDSLNRVSMGHQKLIRCDARIARGIAERVPHIYYKIAYPRLFEKEIRFALERVDVPEELVLAIMRQESGFIPDACSFAQAKGLMQVIYSSGLMQAKAWRIEKLQDQELYVPEINILLATSLLQKYWQQFGNITLGLAAYNAGPSRAKMWSKRNENAPQDAIIADLSINETRHYVDNVMGGAYAYSILHGKRPPRLSLTNK